MNARFLVHLFFAVLLTLAVCVCLHIIADPYDLYGTRKIEGFNKVKAVIGSKQRVFETVEVMRSKPQGLILGTSRSDIGIDPQHPAFVGLNAFNAAASGQQIWESREILAKLVARAKRPPKRVVIGLDFMAFNALAPTPFDYSPDNFDRYRALELLFSISTTLDSFRTLQRQNYEYQLGLGGLMRNDGLRESNGNPALSARARFQGSDEGYLRTGYKPPPHCTFATVDEAAKRDLIEDFRQILRLSHDKKIDLRLFISPSHARQWETLAAAGLWPQFEDWKRALTRINAEEAARANHAAFPLWDFSGYNSITTETIPNAGESKNYWESSHYHKELGNQLLNRLFGLAPSPVTDFGHVITTANIEAWLAQTRRARTAYGKSHSAEIEDIRKIAEKVAMDSPCAHPESADNLDPAAKER